MDASETQRFTAATLSAIALSLSMVSPAAAVEVRLDERTGPAFDLHTCGVAISGSSQLFASDGMGVLGGLSDSYVDGTESFEFEFDEPQSSAWFDLNDAADLNNDGVPGRAILEAYDAGGASMGARLTQGDGLKELSDFYGAVPLSRVVVTVLGDAIRFASVGYVEIGAVELDFRHSGHVDSQTTSTPTVCGVRFVGNNHIVYDDVSAGDGGLGVAGGVGWQRLDGSEWMRMEFPYPVDELVLESLLYGYDADFYYGEAMLFAYDEFGNGIGSMNLRRHSLFGGPLAQTVDVAAAIGGGSSEIEIFSMGDGRRLDKVIYAPEPAGGAALATLALAAIARGRARRATC